MSVYEGSTESQQFASKVIADHARATAFSIADGILPGNEGRNYVLRKIMRRAIYHGRHTLGFNEEFFNEVTNFVVDQMNHAFPELESQRDFIRKMVRLEEQRFGTTLTVGLNKLDELFSATGVTMPDFKQLARLYDTFGIPRDLIRVALEERGFEVGESEFNEKFDEAARQIQLGGNVASGGGASAKAIKGAYGKVAERGASQFRGYDLTSVSDSVITSLIKGEEEVSQLEPGDEGEVVLDQTPFYAESGGQVGDTGRLVSTAD